VTTNDINSANVLSGLVRAGGIHAEAEATSNGSTVHITTNGSRFTSLSVQGHPAVNASVDANTRLTIEGLGYVYLKRTIVSGATIQVRMIEVVVTEENSYGLPVGTQIIIGRAKAGVQ
jgi:hypothetical protein